MLACCGIWDLCSAWIIHLVLTTSRQWEFIYHLNTSLSVSCGAQELNCNHLQSLTWTQFFLKAALFWLHLHCIAFNISAHSSLLPALEIAVKHSVAFVHFSSSCSVWTLLGFYRHANNVGSKTFQLPFYVWEFGSHRLTMNRFSEGKTACSHIHRGTQEWVTHWLTRSKGQRVNLTKGLKTKFGGWELNEVC